MNNLLNDLKPLIEWNKVIKKKYGQDFFKEHATSQQPWITLISCCDSRVHPQILLEQPIDQIFSVNVIGNAVKAAEGSVDYGIYHLETPVLLILGHSDCGAVKACIAGYEDEPDSIKTALKPVNDSFIDGKKERVSDNVVKNVLHQTAVACKSYQDLVESEKLMIVGAYYDLANDFEKGYGKLNLININGKML